MIGVHKAQDAHKMLDVDKVPNESMVYENGEELTHLYPRSGVGEGYVQCIHDMLTEHMIHEDVASKDAQWGAMCKDAETCGNSKMANSYMSHNDADTCVKGKGCEVGME